MRRGLPATLAALRAVRGNRRLRPRLDGCLRFAPRRRRRTLPRRPPRRRRPQDLSPTKPAQAPSKRPPRATAKAPQPGGQHPPQACPLGAACPTAGDLYDFCKGSHSSSDWDAIRTRRASQGPACLTSKGRKALLQQIAAQGGPPAGGGGGGQPRASPSAAAAAAPVPPHVPQPVPQPAPQLVPQPAPSAGIAVPVLPIAPGAQVPECSAAGAAAGLAGRPKARRPGPSARRAMRRTARTSDCGCHIVTSAGISLNTSQLPPRHCYFKL
jgi:hypothetical protein